MSLKGLPVAFGGLGASVSGSSAGLAEDEAEEEDALDSELGVPASGCEPPQATSDKRAMDEQRLNRENRLMAFS
jgi:hypothetical protein